MSDSLDLKNIEKKAFRTTYQDGLLDIDIGGVMLCASFLAYTMHSEASTLLRFGLYLAGTIVCFLIYWGGKKYFTTPRLGQVKYGPRRQKRKWIMVCALAGIVLIQVLVLVGTVILWRNPGWASRMGLHLSNRDLERMVVAAIGALFVGPSMLFIAYMTEFLRGYYIAVVFSLAVFTWIWFGQPIYLIIAGLLIIIPGVVIFVRFMREHPLPPAEASHE